MKYLLDTCIWIDFYEDRFGRGGRPLGHPAAQLFMRILNDHDHILFSESLLLELRTMYSEEEIYLMLDLLSVTGHLMRIEITPEEYSEAKKLHKVRKIPRIDCLNAVQARNHDATLISQDRHILEDLADVADTKKPEDII